MEMKHFWGKMIQDTVECFQAGGLVMRAELAYIFDPVTILD